MSSPIQLLAALVLMLSTLGGFCPAQALTSAQPAGLADGPGLWVNIWNYPKDDLDVYCNHLKNHGMRNLFIQTSRSNTPAIAHPEDLGPLIEACHRHHIRVIGWSFADLIDPQADADKLMQAARFISPNKEKLDGIAGDLELNLSEAKVEAYSRKLREDLGPNYPLIAVVYSPLNQATQASLTPWKVLGKYWNVIAPMTYWSGKHQKLDPYTYTTVTIQKVRELVGQSDIEVHPIGDGMRATNEGIKSFLQACKDNEAVSASLYPNQKPTADQLLILSRYSDYFQDNARFRLAAYRELRKSGKMPEPPKGDPSQFISRGEFYRLLVHHVYAKVGSSPTTAQAVETLVKLQMLDEPGSHSLNQPIASTEAFNLLAMIIQAQGRPVTAAHKKHRADSWLVQPAAAESSGGAKSAGIRPLNYLDAAQLVLLSGASLRH